MRILLSYFLALGLSGCVWNIDKPPPAWWSYFAGNGASENEIRLALLECGSSVPGDPIEFPAPGGGFIPNGGLNEIVFVKHCMMNAGFPFDGRRDTCKGWTDTMTGKHIPADFPACKPDAVIPKRSVETRLNSPYCKTFPNNALCQPVVVREVVWDAKWNETHKEEIETRRLKLDEVKRQGYSTSVGTGEAKYCREEARKNASQTEAKFYFEKCLKEKFKVWNPFLSFE